MAYKSLSLVRWPRAIAFDNATSFVRTHICRNLHTEKTSASAANNNDPLHGIRILDLTRIVAGPYCTMVLGDLGAEVVKIERPGSGDECRHWGPPFLGNPPESCYFLCLNRNKKSVCIDMKSSEGRQILLDLAKNCDVLVENYVPGKLDEMGLGYGSFKEVAPHLIYCSITGFGPEGPYKDRPGYDVVAASMGGLLHITGPSDGKPCKVGVAMTDIMTGLYAHGAIMAALLKRARTGLGQKIDCNLLSTQISCLINIGANFLMGGIEAQRHGTAHPSIVPYQTFKTGEGGYLTIGTGSDAQFRALCSKMNLSSLLHDERFKTNADRVKNRVELIQLLKDTFLTKSKKEWLDILEGAAFPYGPVNSMSEPEPTRTVRLKLRRPKSKKKVQWGAETVDNENLNRKKSKCCCVYKKPRAFDESSSDTDDECEHCKGHVEVKHHHKNGDTEPTPGSSAEVCQRRPPPAEPLNTPEPEVNAPEVKSPPELSSETKSSSAISASNRKLSERKNGPKETIRSKRSPINNPQPRQHPMRRVARPRMNSRADNVVMRRTSSTNRIPCRKVCDKCTGSPIARSVPRFRVKIRTVDKIVQTNECFLSTLTVRQRDRHDGGDVLGDGSDSQKNKEIRKSARRRCVCL